MGGDVHEFPITSRGIEIHNVNIGPFGMLTAAARASLKTRRAILR
jgi:hypothetical protein